MKHQKKYVSFNVMCKLAYFRYQVESQKILWNCHPHLPQGLLVIDINLSSFLNFQETFTGKVNLVGILLGQLTMGTFGRKSHESIQSLINSLKCTE